MKDPSEDCNIPNPLFLTGHANEDLGVFRSEAEEVGFDLTLTVDPERYDLADAAVFLARGLATLFKALGAVDPEAIKEVINESIDETYNQNPPSSSIGMN